MAILVSGTGIERGAGAHVVQVAITTGTVTLAMSLDDGSTYQDIEGGVISATTDLIIDIAECYIKATMSGTATAVIKRIRYPV